jgi:hypothetical protein
MADQPTLTIPVPIYRRAEGRLSFLPAGHTDRAYAEAMSSRRIDIDYVNDLATLFGVREPFTPIGVAVAGRAGMFGLSLTRGPDFRALRSGGAAPDAPPPPPPTTRPGRKGSKRRASNNT